MAYRKRFYGRRSRRYSGWYPQIGLPRRAFNQFRKHYTPFVKSGESGKVDSRYYPGGLEKRLYGPFPLRNKFGPVSVYMNLGDLVKYRARKKFRAISKALIRMYVLAGRLGLSMPHFLCGVGHGTNADGSMYIPNLEDIVKGSGGLMTGNELMRAATQEKDYWERFTAEVPYFNGEVFGSDQRNPQTNALLAMGGHTPATAAEFMASQSRSGSESTMTSSTPYATSSGAGFSAFGSAV